MILHYIELFNDLYNSSQYQRPDVKYLIDKINFKEKNISFNNFKQLLSEVVNLSSDQIQITKNIFIMCFCRSSWELFFNLASL